MYDIEYTSIHGICFDEGQSGNCGLECRGLLSNQCEIEDEMLESCSFNEIYDTGEFIDYLIDKFIGEFRMQIFMQQTKIEFDINKHLENMRNGAVEPKRIG